MCRCCAGIYGGVAAVFGGSAAVFGGGDSILRSETPAVNGGNDDVFSSGTRANVRVGCLTCVLAVCARAATTCTTPRSYTTL
eukprot:233735-Rhodomonas_salina.2